jgi:chromosome segregation ATPase
MSTPSWNVEPNYHPDGLLSPSTYPVTEKLKAKYKEVEAQIITVKNRLRHKRSEREDASATILTLDAEMEGLRARHETLLDFKNTLDLLVGPTLELPNKA